MQEEATRQMNEITGGDHFRGLIRNVNKDCIGFVHLPDSLKRSKRSKRSKLDLRPCILRDEEKDTHAFVVKQSNPNFNSKEEVIVQFIEFLQHEERKIGYTCVAKSSWFPYQSEEDFEKKLKAYTQRIKQWVCFQRFPNGDPLGITIEKMLIREMFCRILEGNNCSDEETLVSYKLDSGDESPTFLKGDLDDDKDMEENQNRKEDEVTPQSESSGDDLDDNSDVSLLDVKKRKFSIVSKSQINSCVEGVVLTGKKMRGKGEEIKEEKRRYMLFPFDNSKEKKCRH